MLTAPPRSPWRPLVGVLVALAFASALWRTWPWPGASLFLASGTGVAAPLRAEFSADVLPIAAASAHAPSLAQLPDGRVAAAWFAGSREGAEDVAIWFSRLEATGWTAPYRIATRESIAAATLSHVRKLGNPVLYADGNHLHLWVVSAGVGGWAASAINHSQSGDAGLTWSPAERLHTSAFFNLGTLVRSPPLPLADGGLGLPVYHELLAKHGEWLRLDSQMRLVDKVRLPGSGPQLQPAVVALDPQRAFAALRDAGPGPGRVRASLTTDGGAQWQALSSLPMGNPNSSVALLRLSSGRLLLAGNPASGRQALELWLSAEAGKDWKRVRTIESSPEAGAEFSYPALLLARDQRIHLAWTWRRQSIKHAVFSEAWLESEP